MSFLQRKDPVYEGDMVDLFAGPGGLDVAATWMGLKAVGVEWDENARKTRQAAGLLTTEDGDVRHHSPEQFPEAKILVGGPPCQTFTVAGSGVGRRALDRVRSLVREMGHRQDVRTLIDSLGGDERTGLVLQPLRWALEAYRKDDPYRAIVLEQVPAVRPVWDEMAMVLEQEMGYKTDVEVLRTEEFGVPQTRRRAILVAHLDHQPRLPEKGTHQSYFKGMKRPPEGSTPLPWTTMAEALAPERRTPFTVISNYGTGGDPKARGQRRHDEPAFTVTGKISRNRLEGRAVKEGVNDRFTEDEAGRLQTFPKGYPWSGRDRAQQIGNAIPPRLAAHVLAAALGLRLNEARLDAAVKADWTESQKIRVVDDESVAEAIRSVVRPVRKSRQETLAIGV